MSYDPHANGAYSVVAVAPTPATSGTGIILSAGDGALFPDPAVVGAYNVSIWPVSSGVFTKNNGEIVRFTAKSGDSFAMTRAQEGSSARAIVIGDQVAMAPTAKVFTDIQQAITPITLPAYAWVAAIGSPTRATVGSWDAVIDTWTLHHGATDGLLTGTVLVPGAWRSVNVYMTVLSLGGGGNARLVINGLSMVDNNTIVATAADNFGFAQTVNVVGGTGLLKTLLGSVTVTQDTQFRVIVARDGTNVLDTATAGLPFVNVILSPA